MRRSGPVVALALGLAVAVLTPSLAHAGGCTDSWTNTAGGSWFTGANWSNDAPPTSEEVACITANGTYTVEMAQKSTVIVKSLTVGGASGTQTLVVASTNGLSAVLMASGGLTTTAHTGALVLTNAESAGNNVTIVGPIANAGELVTEPAHGGQRNLKGRLTNTGTLAINANTTYDATKVTLTNEGTLELAEGVALAISGDATVNDKGGTILATGNGALTESGGKFNQGGGTMSGSEPVILENTALNYTGGGGGRIAVRGEGTTLKGTVNGAFSGALSIQGTCGASAKVTVTGNLINYGTIDLTNGDGCGNNATLALGGNTLTSWGTINSESAHGGARTIEGAVVNYGLVALSAGETLKVTGAYTQNTIGRLQVQIASESSFGALSAAGAATVAGQLILRVVSPFVASLGQTFPIVAGASLMGTFASERDARINTSGLYYKPTYAPTGVTLAVTQATLELSPSSGSPGSTVTLKGGGFLPGDTITPTFYKYDATKIYPPVTTNGSGEFSTKITIPASLTKGASAIYIKSTQTSVYFHKTFTVT